ncbi:DNA repair protein RecO [Yeosuana sp. MJ-SS3]|uniref:DNA repair protein RecO n=1 Tax=Gilvirhabdus luticola TaxID=3079858 RepID=A0ABU3U338_9FLAO|nr:DNA repair protein RecO [Yeosuana sp. MJ-SS3]MDU8884808.1 DNA repair protein RecO [Yeosuana sp. MJ-SS3]
MVISTKAIVISKIKYGDSDLIVKCYTQELGMVSYMLKGVLKSKKGKVKTAYFQLLSQLDIETIHRANRSFQSIKDLRMNHMYVSLHTNVLKSTIVMFLAEVLSSCLIEEEKNRTLYNYIETAFLWLDQHDNLSNFHLLFLLKLSRYLGFYPDTTNIDFDFFNLIEGKFEDSETGLYTISGQNLVLLKRLLGINFDELNTIKLNSKQRQSFLKIMLLYFDLHLSGFKEPKSLQLFYQVFN